MAKKETENTIITIKPIKRVSAEITIVGDTPLIVHAWGVKAKREMLANEQKKGVDKKAKPPRDPFSDFVQALYWITQKPEKETPEAFEKACINGAKFGFPVIAIKMAALSAAYRAGLIQNQVGMKTSFFINAVDGGFTEDGLELGAIETPEPPECQESMVRLSGPARQADLRYRPLFKNWKMRLKITLIDTGVFDMESIINAIEMAGLMNGIGEWRVERDGDFGRFHVEV